MSDKPIEDMNFGELASFLAKQPRTAPLKICTAATQRLINIALYDHHVSLEERTNALKLLESVKSSTESALADKPEALDAYRDAYQTQEAHVRRFGIGSIPWLIKEKDVPPEEMIPFAMRPQYGTHLADFIQTIGEDLYRKARPDMIKRLILTRRLQSANNCVLILHGFASSFDPATVTLFSTEELDWLVGAPDDYARARSVLVDAGLLPATGHARALTKPAPQFLNNLAFALISVMRDWFAEDKEVVELMRTLPAHFQTLISITGQAVGAVLASRMLRSLYGEAVAQEAMAGLNELQDILDSGSHFHFAKIVEIVTKAESLIRDGLREGRATLSVNWAVLDTVADMFGFGPTDDKSMDGQRAIFSTCNTVLGHYRCEYLSRLRFDIRWFNGRYPEGSQKQASKIDEATREELSKLYAIHGAEAGIAEAATYFEDWIGA